MHVCTCFGHRDTPEGIKPYIIKAIEELISTHGVDTFYVGNQGKFDSYVRGILRSLSEKYPHIRYFVVLAYFPKKNDEDYSDTIIPDGLELVHPRFAIAHRNEWLVKNADFVIGYISRPIGGANRYFELAKKRGKTAINLAENFTQTKG